ncbi:hypothetical protein OROHE_000240 [Orobanche hederae]
MAAEKEARAFDDLLDGLQSSSSPSTNRGWFISRYHEWELAGGYYWMLNQIMHESELREKQAREKKQKTEGQYGEKAAENEALEREEAEARKMRYDNVIKEARECFRDYAAANKIESDIGQVKLCEEDDTKWAFTRIKCGVPTFAENLDEKNSETLDSELSEKV